MPIGTPVVIGQNQNGGDVSIPISVSGHSAGDYLIVKHLMRDNEGTLGISDNGTGGAWSQLNVENNNAAELAYALYGKFAAGDETTITVTNSGATNESAVAWKISGVDSTNPANDASENVTNINNTSANSQVSSLTSSISAGIAFQIFGYDLDPGTPPGWAPATTSYTAGFTTLLEYSTASRVQIAILYKAITATGDYSCTATESTGAGKAVSTAITIKEAGSGGGSVIPQITNIINQQQAA